MGLRLFFVFFRGGSRFVLVLGWARLSTVPPENRGSPNVVRAYQGRTRFPGFSSSRTVQMSSSIGNSALTPVVDAQSPSVLNAIEILGVVPVVGAT